MDINQIAKTLSQTMGLNQSQQNNLSTSIEKAREILNTVNNPTDALKKANVDVNFLNKIRGYLNNPMYGIVISMLGINKEIALQKLNALEEMMGKDKTTTSFNDLNKSLPMSQGNDLERFKRGLKSLK